ncbi:pali-domain-containing protein [Obba rivulosa]|uniref:Pali-domain-containing protein n=1 Tax=Obba rivulosa TaxID=1052685 RepID=A0A8E2ANT0_9APHY|nr:pali-domain-containing protein [Obba rivulosa]
MSRAFHLPGVFFLFCAFILLLLVSISLPFLPALDVARVSFHDGNIATGANSAAMTQLRFGIWAYCWYDDSGNRICSPTEHGYSTTLTDFGATSQNAVTIGSSWTRGLAVHPVAAGVTLIAFLFSLSAHVTMILLASLLSFLAAVLTLIAFAIDIALFAFVKHEMGHFSDVSKTTDPAPAFWMTLASFIVLCLAGCTVCFGRRRDRMAGAKSYAVPSAKPSWADRFRRT